MLSSSRVCQPYNHRKRANMLFYASVLIGCALRCLQSDACNPMQSDAMRSPSFLYPSLLPRPLQVFWLMFLLVFVQGVVAVLNMVAPPKWQPRKACWCLQPCLTVAYLVVFLLVWIMATVFCK